MTTPIAWWTIRKLKAYEPAVYEPAIDELVAKRAVRPLVRALRKDVYRHSAAVALARIGEPAVGPLIKALQTRDPWARAAAAGALGVIGDARAVPELIHILNDEKEWVRTAAAKALGAVGDARAVEPLLRALYHGDDAERDIKREALLRIGAVGTLVELLEKSPEAALRSRAATMLGLLANASAASPLGAALADPDYHVRSEALDGLGHLGSAALPTLLEALERAEGEDLRRDILKVIETIGDPEAVGPLLDLLESSSGRLRESIVWTLGKLGDGRAVGKLIELLPHEKGAAQALGEIGDRRAVEPLIACLERDDSRRGREEEAASPAVARLAWALGALGDSRAVGPLLQLLARSPDEGGWEPVVAALGRIGDPGAVEPLVSRWKELEVEGRDGLCDIEEALGEIGDERALEVLVPALRHDDLHVRLYAVRALAKIRSPRAVEPLVSLLQKEEYFRGDIAEALGEHGGVRAIPLLEEYLREGMGSDAAAQTRRALEKLRASAGVSGPSAVSVVAFRVGGDQPGDPEAAIRRLVDRRVPGAAIESWRLVGVREAISASDAASLYRQLVLELRLPHMGRQIGAFSDEWIDGEKASGLIFSSPDEPAIAAASIDARSLDMLAAYWRDRAVTWWSERSSPTAICDGCNREIARDAGFLHGTYLLCERCCEQRLDGALEKLRANPDYFGDNELVKARARRDR